MNKVLGLAAALVGAMAAPVLVCAAEVQVSKSVITCLEPPEPKISVASQDEQKNYRCSRWSEPTFITTNVEDRRSFVMPRCGDAKLRPLNQYAKFVLNGFRTKYGLPPIALAPSTRRLYKEYTSLGLRALREGESRENSIAVWWAPDVTEGMLGVVYQDASPPGKLALDKLMIRYAGKAYEPKDCGEIVDAPASVALKDHLLKQDAKEEPLFLTIDTPSMFWNYWIEDGGEEAPPKIKPGRNYQFHISLSSIDYSTWGMGADPMLRQAKLAKGVAANSVPSLGGALYRLTILKSSSIGGETAVYTVLPVGEKLQASLESPPTAAASRPELALKHDALNRQENGVIATTGGGLRYAFTASDKAPCASLAVIVQDQNNRLVSSWAHSFSVDDGTGRDCNASASTSRRVDLVSLFDVPLEGSDAQLGFMEFSNPNRTVAIYAGGDTAPLIWNLANDSLTTVLSEMATDFNGVIRGDAFDPRKWSRSLSENILFSCSDLADDDCPGSVARDSINALANADARKRLQVSLRDASNSRGYLPGNLIALVDGTLLGQKVDVVQHLPRAATDRASECVSPLTGSFLIESADDTTSGDLPKPGELVVKWRERWWTNLVSVPSEHIGMPALSKYLGEFNSQSPSEALFVMAHHGVSGISDVASNGDLIRPGDIKRTFGRSSFAVLAMCSVGAPSSGKSDSGTVIDKLNSSNVRAVIMSPYAVSVDTATIFLDSMRSELSLGLPNRSLREIFNSATNSIRKVSVARYRRAALTVETFMLVGDGSVKVCR